MFLARVHLRMLAKFRISSFCDFYRISSKDFSSTSCRNYHRNTCLNSSRASFRVSLVDFAKTHSVMAPGYIQEFLQGFFQELLWKSFTKILLKFLQVFFHGIPTATPVADIHKFLQKRISIFSRDSFKISSRFYSRIFLVFLLEFFFILLISLHSWIFT